LNDYAASSISAKALDILLAGLSKKDQDKMITALIQQELKRAYATPEDENTFMRGTSLPKTALMYYLKREIAVDGKIAEDFLNDPFTFISNLKVPDHIKAALGGAVDAKIDRKAPLYGVAHNIVFSMITGPVLKHFNDQWEAAKGTPAEEAAKQKYYEAVKAVDMLTQINSVQVQTTDKGMEAAIAKTLDKKITPAHMERYVASLEKLMTKMSDQYDPSALKITFEVLENYTKFHNTYSAPIVETAKQDGKVDSEAPQQPISTSLNVKARESTTYDTSRPTETAKIDVKVDSESPKKSTSASPKEKARKFIAEVIEDLKKFIKEWKPTPPSWTTKSSTKLNSEAKDINTKDGVSDKTSGGLKQTGDEKRPSSRLG
jgi:hypothetical protein